MQYYRRQNVYAVEIYIYVVRLDCCGKFLLARTTAHNTDLAQHTYFKGQIHNGYNMEF